MKKKIQVIVKDEKESLISVSRGYAFNYLIPKKNAKIPTKKQIKQIEMFKCMKKEKQEIHATKTKEIKKRIEEISKISIYKKIGENQLIFGSITEKDISEWIEKHTNLKIDKTQIKIPDIKKIGTANLNIQIQQDMTETIQINILPVNI